MTLDTKHPCLTLIGNGTKVYQFDFPFNLVTDIVVDTRTDDTTDFAPITTFTVDPLRSGLQNPSQVFLSGTIHLNQPLSAPAQIRIRRIVSVDQPVSFDNTISAPSKMTESALDYLAQVDQQQQCQIEDMETRIIKSSEVIKASTDAKAAASQAASSALSATTAAGNAGIAQQKAEAAFGKALTAVTDAQTAASQASHSLGQIGTAVTDAQTAANNANHALGQIGTAVTDAQAAQHAAQTAATNAANSATTATNAVSQIGTSATDAIAAKLAAQAAATGAQTAATNAANSATTATNAVNSIGTSVTDAQAAKLAAQTSATNAATSATNAANSLSQLGTAVTDAQAAKTAAQTAATQASTSAQQATNTVTTVQNLMNKVPDPATGQPGDTLSVENGVYKLHAGASGAPPEILDSVKMTKNSGVIQGCHLSIHTNQKSFTMTAGKVLYVSEEDGIPATIKVIDVGANDNIPISDADLGTVKTFYIYVSVHPGQWQAFIAIDDKFEQKARGGKILIGVALNSMLNLIDEVFNVANYVTCSDYNQFSELKFDGAYTTGFNLSALDATHFESHDTTFYGAAINRTTRYTNAHTELDYNMYGKSIIAGQLKPTYQELLS
ncbi:MAG: hypothetical protein ACRCX2_10485, partial [Paraclostridium sp.]